MTGAANTMIGVWALGPGTGVDLLLLPCLLLATLLFGAGEAWLSLAAGAVTVLAYLVVEGAVAGPQPRFPPTTLASLYALHLGATACLIVIIGRLAATLSVD